MPPVLTLLTNASSPSVNFPHAPQPTAFHFGNSYQNQWGPDSIGTIVFGFVMFFMGVVALWQQGRARTRRREQAEEEGQRALVGGAPVAVADDVAMVEFPGGLGGERLGVGMEEQDADAMEQGFVKIERGMRMDTEGTLVGHDDDEGEVKELQD